MSDNKDDLDYLLDLNEDRAGDNGDDLDSLSLNEMGGPDNYDHSDDEGLDDVDFNETDLDHEAGDGDQQEDEDEDENEVKPKSSISPFVIAAGVLGVIGMAGAAGYVVLGKGDSSEKEFTPVLTSMPATNFNDLGSDITIPSTNLVDGKEAPEKASPITGLGVADNIDFDSADEHEPNEVVGHTQPIPIIDSSPVVSEVIKAPNYVVGNGEENINKVVDNQLIEEIAPSLVKIVAESPLEKPSVDIGQYVTKDELRLVVVEAVSAAIKNSSSIGKGHQAPVINRLDVIKEINDAKDAANKALVDKAQKIAENAISGKERIAGYKVINFSEDGAISIVRSSAGRVFALFKGENFTVNGRRMVVSDILNGGKVIISGSMYIDELLVEPAKVVRKEVKRPSPARKAEAKVSQDQGLSGWSIHAAFEGGEYLVKSPSGEYKKVKVGEYVQGAGKIIGLGADGSLKAEKGLIRSQ